MFSFDPAFGADELKKVGKTLDDISETLEEYGTVSLSSPLLIPANSKKRPFDFTLNKQGADAVDPDWFFLHARTDVNGAVSTNDIAELSVKLAVQVQQSSLTKKARDQQERDYADDKASYNRRKELAQQEIDLQYQADLAAIPNTLPDEEQKKKRTDADLKRVSALKDLEVATRPTFPGAPADSAQPPELPNAEKGAIPASFSDRGSLTTKSKEAPHLEFPLRSSLIAAAGHQSTYGLLRVLGNPADYVEFADKKVLMGVAMVNVDPGWRTKYNYVGEVSVTAHYEYQPARPELIFELMKADPHKNPQLRLAQELIRAYDPKWAVAVLPPADEIKARQEHLINAFRDLRNNVNATRVTIVRLKDQLSGNPSLNIHVVAAGTDAVVGDHLAQFDGRLGRIFEDVRNHESALRSGFQNPVDENSEENIKTRLGFISSRSDSAKAMAQELLDLTDDLKTVTQAVGSKANSLNGAQPQPADHHFKLSKETNSAAFADGSGETNLVIPASQYDPLSDSEKGAYHLEQLENVRRSTRQIQLMTTVGFDDRRWSPPGAGLIPDRLVATEDRSPLVAAVSPMTDLENLDLQSSTRRQWEIAAQLAGVFQQAGYDVQAKLFASYAKRLERDVQTQSALPTLTAFSHSGGLFGFRAGPRLRANADVAALSGKPGSELERQAFPVLIMIGMDGDDVGIRFRWDRDRAVPVEPVLKFTQSMRWSPIKRPRFYNSISHFDQERFTSVLKRFSNAQATLDRSDSGHFVKLAQEATSLRSYLVKDKSFDASLRFALARAVAILEEAKTLDKTEISRRSYDLGLSEIAAIHENLSAVDNIKTGLQAAADYFGKSAEINFDHYSQAIVLREKARSLGQLGFGASNTQNIPISFFEYGEPAPTPPPPPPVVPRVSGIAPAQLFLPKGAVTMTVIATGDGLKNVKSVRTTAGAGSKAGQRGDCGDVIVKEGSAVTFSYTPKLTSDPEEQFPAVGFDLLAEDGSVVALTPAIEIVRPKSLPSDITIERRAAPSKPAADALTSSPPQNSAADSVPGKGVLDTGSSSATIASVPSETSQSEIPLVEKIVVSGSKVTPGVAVEYINRNKPNTVPGLWRKKDRKPVTVGNSEN